MEQLEVFSSMSYDGLPSMPAVIFPEGMNDGNPFSMVPPSVGVQDAAWFPSAPILQQDWNHQVPVPVGPASVNNGSRVTGFDTMIIKQDPEVQNLMVQGPNQYDGRYDTATHFGDFGGPWDLGEIANYHLGFEPNRATDNPMIIEQTEMDHGLIRARFEQNEIIHDMLATRNQAFGSEFVVSNIRNASDNNGFSTMGMHTPSAPDDQLQFVANQPFYNDGFSMGGGGDACDYTLKTPNLYEINGRYSNLYSSDPTGVEEGNHGDGFSIDGDGADTLKTSNLHEVNGAVEGNHGDDHRRFLTALDDVIRLGMILTASSELAQRQLSQEPPKRRSSHEDLPVSIHGIDNSVNGPTIQLPQFAAPEPPCSTTNRDRDEDQGMEARIAEQNRLPAAMAVNYRPHQPPVRPPALPPNPREAARRPHEDHVPEFPREGRLRQIADSHGFEPIFLFQKQLTQADISLSQCRLLVPKRAIGENFPKLFSPDEIRQYSDGDGLFIGVTDERGETYEMKLKHWRPPGSFVLQGKWKQFIIDWQLDAGRYGVRVWGTRRPDVPQSAELMITVFNLQPE